MSDEKSDRARGKKKREIDPNLPAPGVRAEAWLNELFERLNMKVNVGVSAGGDGVEVNLTGDDADLLKVHKGIALTSLQTVAQQIESIGGRRTHVNMDIGSFTQDRTGRLEALTEALENKLDDVKGPLTIFGMDSFERKAVHRSLGELEGVATESTGYGPFRRLKITVN